jgi:indolepyruvate decarboxylase
MCLACRARDIDYLLDTAHRLKRPVYLELPRDMVSVVPDQIRPYVHPPRVSDPEALAEAVREAAALEPFVLAPDAPMTTTRLVRRLDESLDDRTIVIADVGDALFASSDLVIRGQTEFIAPAYYTSMGFTVPAALGAKTARPDLKVIALVGDGAFQMTGMELSTIVRRGLAVTVIVLDNKGYGTERLLHEGTFNDINPWQSQRIPEVLGGGTGWDVHTEGQFDEALRAALADEQALNIIRVHIGLDDRSQTLDRLAAGLARRVER